MSRGGLMSRIVFLIWCALLLVLAPACGGGLEPATDYAGLVDSLRDDGATVETAGVVGQPFFSVPGRMIRVNGEDVQVFEYQDSTSAKAEAKLVSSDGGTIGTTAVTWVAPPHFYQSGRLIVLYVGENDIILGLLEGSLGEQYAGQ